MFRVKPRWFAQFDARMALEKQEDPVPRGFFATEILSFLVNGMFTE
jgi:hypothetical protein